MTISIVVGAVRDRGPISYSVVGCVSVFSVGAGTAISGRMTVICGYVSASF